MTTQSSSSSSSPSSAVTFADLLRYYRTAAGLTQEELADRAHLSVDAISTLERGERRRPRKETVALLAAAPELAPDDRAAFVDVARHSPLASLAATTGEDAASDGRLPTAPVGLPQGVVTLLIADAEGFALLHTLGDEYDEVLTTVHDLLRTVWLSHHGHELGTQGDRFFVVFAHPDDAVAAAVATQQALATHPRPGRARVWLRIGIHSGFAQMTAGRYVGVEVHRALQIAAAGHAGQVLVSQAAIAEIAKRGQALPPGVPLKSLGMHRLSGLRQREAVSQLILPGIPELPSHFPPLRTLRPLAHRTRAPAGGRCAATRATGVGWPAAPVGDTHLPARARRVRRAWRIGAGSRNSAGTDETAVAGAPPARRVADERAAEPGSGTDDTLCSLRHAS